MYRRREGSPVYIKRLTIGVVTTPVAKTFKETPNTGHGLRKLYHTRSTAPADLDVQASEGARLALSVIASGFHPLAGE